MKRPDEPEVRAWLEKATEDFAAARILAQQAPHLDSVIGFYCQQGAEKLFKAALVAHDLDVPKVHDTDTLLERRSV